MARVHAIPRGRLLLSLALVLLGSVGVCAGIVFLPDSPDKEMRRLNREIESGLRVGSSRAEVEQWLSSHGFQPSPIGDSEGHFCSLWVTLPREYFWAGNGDIRMYFIFDKDGRFSGHRLEWDAPSL